MSKLLIETENISRYHTLYITQLFYSSEKYKKLVPASNISQIVTQHIELLLEKQYWTNIVEKLNNDFLESPSKFKYLDDLIIIHKSQNISNWDDIIGIYCLLTIVTNLINEYNIPNFEYIKICSDIINEQHILDWIINNGGWEAYEKKYSEYFILSEKQKQDYSPLPIVKNLTKYKTPLLMSGVLLGTGLFTYFYKK